METLTLYNEKSQNPLPTIIVIINNYEAFAENFEECDNNLVTITRECFKYGIIVIMTASTANSVKYKLTQNFKTLIPLILNDKYDYTSILGKTNGIYPSENLGRGLIKLDDIYEFQTAFAIDRDKQTEFFEQLSLELNKNSTAQAASVPILPTKITPNLLVGKIDKIKGVPIGIYKHNLEIAHYNFKENYANIISSLDMELFTSFINPLIKILQTTSKVVVIDTSNVVTDRKNIEYYNAHFDDIILKLENITNTQYEIYRQNNYDLNVLENEQNITCIIIGLDRFYNRLEKENVTKFNNTLVKGAEIKKNKLYLCRYS